MPLDEWLAQPGVFWGALGVMVAISGLVASLATTAVTAISRHRNRPEADWVLEQQEPWLVIDDPHTHGGTEEYPIVRVSGRLSQVGDAPAFSARLTVEHGSTGVRLLGATERDGRSGDFQAIVRPGDQFFWSASVKPETWDDAVLTIEWVTAPTRRKKTLRWTHRLAQRGSLAELQRDEDEKAAKEAERSRRAEERRR